jgi:hypothetical protein
MPNNKLSKNAYVAKISSLVREITISQTDVTVLMFISPCVTFNMYIYVHQLLTSLFSKVYLLNAFRCIDTPSSAASYTKVFFTVYHSL